MTPEQTRQLLLDVLSTHTAEINGKFNVINEILERIEVQTTKTNGRVNKLEEKAIILELNDVKHLSECPHAARIQSLENTENRKNGVYKFLAVAFGVCTALATLVIAYFEMKK